MKLLIYIFLFISIVHAENYATSSNVEINLKFEACKNDNVLNKVLVSASIIHVGGGATLQSYSAYYSLRNQYDAIPFSKKYIAGNEDLVCKFSEDITQHAKKTGLIKEDKKLS